MFLFDSRPPLKNLSTRREARDIANLGLGVFQEDLDQVDKIKFLEIVEMCRWEQGIAILGSFGSLLLSQCIEVLRRWHWP